MKLDILTTAFLDLRGKLHRLAMRILLDDEDAKDALQETYLRLSRNGEVDNGLEARNKLVTVLRNVCIDRLRRRHTVRLDMAENLSSESSDPYTDDISHLESLLQEGLTSLQMTIYNMVIHQGLEYEEIALQLNMKVDTVRTNMCRTRKKIRENYNRLNR